MPLCKRNDDKFFNGIMLAMYKDCIKKSSSSESEQSDEDDSGTSGDSRPSKSSPIAHKSKIKIDATCTDAEIRYPTDINILRDSNRDIERLVQRPVQKLVSQDQGAVAVKLVRASSDIRRRSIRCSLSFFWKTPQIAANSLYYRCRRLFWGNHVQSG